jgi:hypothetical protein
MIMIFIINKKFTYFSRVYFKKHPGEERIHSLVISYDSFLQWRLLSSHVHHLVLSHFSLFFTSRILTININILSIIFNMGFLSLEWAQWFGKKKQTLPDLSNFCLRSNWGKRRWRVILTKSEVTTELQFQFLGKAARFASLRLLSATISHHPYPAKYCRGLIIMEN